MIVAAPITVQSTPLLPSQVISLTAATSVALPAIRLLISVAAPWSAASSGAHCRRTRMRRTAKTSAAAVTMTSGVRRRRRRSRVSAERAVELPAVRSFTLIAPDVAAETGAGLRRDAERDGGRPSLDPHVLTRRARAAVELVRDLPVEPDRELRSARYVGEPRVLGPAASELSEGPGPFDRVLSGDHAELEEP